MYVSVMENAGISTGNPPACQTPRLTASARSRRWAWQGLISLQVLMMAITGLPVKSSLPVAELLHARAMAEAAHACRDRTSESCEDPRKGEAWQVTLFRL